MNLHPIHLETTPSEWNGGAFSQYPVIFGVQPKGMRWQAYNVTDLSSFQVTLYDHRLQPLDFGIQGSFFELVFDVEWCDDVMQSKAWKTDRVYMNSMNS